MLDRFFASVDGRGTSVGESGVVMEEEMDLRWSARAGCDDRRVANSFFIVLVALERNEGVGFDVGRLGWERARLRDGRDI